MTIAPSDPIPYVSYILPPCVPLVSVSSKSTLCGTSPVRTRPANNDSPGRQQGKDVLCPVRPQRLRHARPFYRGLIALAHSNDIKHCVAAKATQPAIRTRQLRTD